MAYDRTVAVRVGGVSGEGFDSGIDHDATSLGSGDHGGYHAERAVFLGVGAQQNLIGVAIHVGAGTHLRHTGRLRGDLNGEGGGGRRSDADDAGLDATRFQEIGGPHQGGHLLPCDSQALSAIVRLISLAGVGEEAAIAGGSDTLDQRAYGVHGLLTGKRADPVIAHVGLPHDFNVFRKTGNGVEIVDCYRQTGHARGEGRQAPYLYRTDRAGRRSESTPPLAALAERVPRLGGSDRRSRRRFWSSGKRGDHVGE